MNQFASTNRPVEMALYKGATYTDLDDFYIAKAQYEDLKFVNWSIGCSKLLKKRGRQPFSDEFIGKFKYRSISFVCKFSGKPRCTGRNVRQTSSYKQECPAKMFVKLVQMNGRYVLEVAELDEDHDNHVLSKNNYATIPNQRRKALKKNEAYLKATLPTKPNARLLQTQVNMANEDGNVVTLRDIHNFRLREFGSGAAVDTDAFITELQNIKNANVRIITNDRNEIEAIYFQDTQMRKQFELFPELLMCDATYKVNNLNMPLFVALVVDGNGESQVAGLFILKSENAFAIRKSFEVFKELNENHDKIEVILVDKSAANLSAFNDVFPHADIQLCVFHVLQIFNREITTKKRSITDIDRENALEILYKMVYAKSERIYFDLYQQLVALNLEKVTEYFDRNWHEIRQMWVANYVNKLRTFENRTNNRVESFHQKLKTVISRHANISVFFREMLLCINSLNVEKDVRSITRSQKKLVHLTDPVYLKPYRDLITAHAYEKMLVQMRNVERFEFTDLRNEIGIYQSETGNVMTEPTTCNCAFFKTMGLPCKHMIKLRQILGLEVFDISLCLRRWHRQHTLQASVIERNYALQYDTVRNEPEMRVMTQNEKFCKANQLFSSISDILACKNQSVFDTYIGALENMRDMIAQNKFFAAVEINEGEICLFSVKLLPQRFCICH